MIDDYPLALLVDVLKRVVDDAVMDALSEGGYADITRAHGTVFEMIDPGGSRVTDMARRARMTKQGMSQLVAALEELGYLQRAPDPSDRRAQLVQLTEAGERAAAAGRGGLEALEQTWRSLLGERRYANGRRALIDLVRATGQEHVR